jgi:hypothetical protein
MNVAISDGMEIPTSLSEALVVAGSGDISDAAFQTLGMLKLLCCCLDLLRSFL